VNDNHAIPNNIRIKKEKEKIAWEGEFTLRSDP